jgi:hypothetical protein
LYRTFKKHECQCFYNFEVSKQVLLELLKEPALSRSAITIVRAPQCCQVAEIPAKKLKRAGEKKS